MISHQEILIRLFLGALIGGLIGFEREIHGRSAGFRTQLIVCVASVLIMIISENYYYRIHNIDESLRIDPARIAAGALIGIGFLGSGVIIKSGYAVRGLTTAASIWIISAIGLAIGGGLYFEGIITAAFTIVALMVLRVVERRMKPMRFRQIIVSTSSSENLEGAILSILEKYSFHVHSINYEKDHSANKIIYSIVLSTGDMQSLSRLFHELNSQDAIENIKIS